MRAFLLLLASLLLVQPLGGCSVAYYAQAAAGQLEVLRARRPMEQVLKDPATDAGLRERLLVADSALVFARIELGLPRADGYRKYADLGRRFVAWNVFAAEEFSLEPRTWCFPVAGCVAYRGWFREERALRDAARLEARGHDVYVGGVAAYSTLGWFPDPLLNTMLGTEPDAIARLIFHELAHRQLYLPGDTVFSESFAAFVEEEGTRRWLGQRRDAGALCRYGRLLDRRAQALGILDELRRELGEVYGSGDTPEQMRRRRQAAFDGARAAYRAVSREWDGQPRFDRWFGNRLNNAMLIALGSYSDHVPAFRALLREAGGDLGVFYDLARDLAARPPDERRRELERLRSAGVSAGRPRLCTGPVA